MAKHLDLFYRERKTGFIRFTQRRNRICFSNLHSGPKTHLSNDTTESTGKLSKNEIESSKGKTSSQKNVPSEKEVIESGKKTTFDGKEVIQKRPHHRS